MLHQNPGLLTTKSLILIMSVPEIWPFTPHGWSSLSSSLVFVPPDLPLLDLLSFLSLWDHVDPFCSANFFHMQRFWFLPPFLLFTPLSSFFLCFFVSFCFVLFCFFFFLLFIYPGQFHPFPQLQNQCRYLNSFQSFTSNNAWHVNLNIPVTPQAQHVQRWVYCLPLPFYLFPNFITLCWLRWDGVMWKEHKPGKSEDTGSSP